MEKSIENSFAGKWIRSTAMNLRRIAVLCIVVALASAAWALTRKQYWTASAITVVPGGQQSSLGLAGIAGLAGDLLPDGLSGIGVMMGMESSAPDMNLVFQVLSPNVRISMSTTDGFRNDRISESHFLEIVGA